MTATALGAYRVAPARLERWAAPLPAAASQVDGAPPDRILELQRSAGNRAVVSVLQRQPKKLPVLDPLDFGSTPPPFEGAISSDPFDRQPEPLRTVIEESGKSIVLTKHERVSEASKHLGEMWWSRLSRQDQQTVVGVYNRMQQLGFWQHVHRIIRVTPAECPVMKRFKVAGVTPSVVFAARGDGITGAVISSGRMCYDAGLGGSLHAPQMSNREISEADSLHLSIGTSTDPELGSGGDFDVHIDRYSSPKGKRGIECEYDPARTLAHEGREVVPGMVHRGKVFGIPVPPIGGFELLPEDESKTRIRPEMFETERDKDKPPLGAAVTWRFEVGGGKQRRRAEAMKAAKEEAEAEAARRR